MAQFLARIHQVGGLAVLGCICCFRRFPAMLDNKNNSMIVASHIFVCECPPYEHAPALLCQRTNPVVGPVGKMVIWILPELERAGRAVRRGTCRIGHLLPAGATPNRWIRPSLYSGRQSVASWPRSLVSRIEEVMLSPSKRGSSHSPSWAQPLVSSPEVDGAGVDVEQTDASLVV